MRKIFIVLAGLAMAASAIAQLAKYKDWDKSPEAYFLTPAERAEWSKVASDEGAETFIALYYARRGGESFKQEISRRIAASDQQFKMQRYKRGADSVRGRLLIVLGPPSRVSQQRAQGGVDDTGGVTAPAISTQTADASAPIIYTWTYDKSKFDESWGLPELRAVVSVEPAVGADSLRNGQVVEKAMATIAEKSIVNPNATLAPAKPAAASVAPVAPAAATGAAGAAPAAATAAAPAMALPAAVKTALEAAAGKPTTDASFWSGTFRSTAGDPFLALQFYLPSDKPAFAGNATLKFGAVVTDEAGAEVKSVWEEAAFAEVVMGTRKDRAFDYSLALAPGSYKAVFGLFAAEGQPPVTNSTVSFKLEPKSSDLEVSPLILSAGLVPLTKRPGPTDPFVFGVEKPIRVEPKGDSHFIKQDSLWFFYTVANAALPAAAPAPAADAAAAQGAAAPAAPAADAPKPRIMTRINVQKDGKDAFAPFTGPAELQPLSAGYYGAGSEIPLASFDPGYYVFLITVRDLNAAKGTPASKGLERKQEFIVLMPDGSQPPKAAPAAAPKKKT